MAETGKETRIMTPEENSIYQATCDFCDKERSINKDELFTIGPSVSVDTDNYIWIYRHADRDWLLWQEEELNKYLNNNYLQAIRSADKDDKKEQNGQIYNPIDGQWRYL